MTTITKAARPSWDLRLHLRDPSRLGVCPACEETVIANASAVRFRSDWYHLRCALNEDSRAVAPHAH